VWLFESVLVGRQLLFTPGVWLEDQWSDADDGAAVRAIDHGDLQVHGVGSGEVGFGAFGATGTCHSGESPFGSRGCARGMAGFLHVNGRVIGLVKGFVGHAFSESASQRVDVVGRGVGVLR